MMLAILENIHIFPHCVAVTWKEMFLASWVSLMEIVSIFSRAIYSVLADSLVVWHLLVFLVTHIDGGQ